jgi:hypothetical protein
MQPQSLAQDMVQMRYAVVAWQRCAAAVSSSISCVGIGQVMPVAAQWPCGCCFADVLASAVHRLCLRNMCWILYVVALLPLGLMFVLPCLLAFCLFCGAFGLENGIVGSCARIC